ncbi:MAG: DUF1579 domain-containing protein [Phycisphaerales bacterium]|nr:DUF1579 domain-containing protein [Phycisphaerales bacterium]
MNRTFRIGLGIGVAGLVAVTSSLALAQSKKDAKPSTAPPAAAPELPPGMTAEQMQACMEAGIPGPMHEKLLESVGTWNGKTMMWMAPGTEPVVSDCTYTIAPMMDGRYLRSEMTGDFPGMGPFSGFGITGFDNVSQKFQLTWIDNWSTGQLRGVGDLSSDGSTLNWTCTYNCPIKKAPATMRQVEKRTGPDAMTMTMYGPDPATGNEFKMMEITFTRKAGGSAKSAQH